MTEKNRQQTRLIPTGGTNGPEEAGRRSTSALLATMSTVGEFASGEYTVYPNVVEASRAGRMWMCLVQPKTGASEFERPQVDCYLDVARNNPFDAALTISNQLAPHSERVDVEVTAEG